MLYEYGQVVPAGISNIKRMAGLIEDPHTDLPEIVRQECRDLVAHIGEKTARVTEKTKALTDLSRQSDTAQRLQTMPSVGPLVASAIKAFAPDMQSFWRGRDFAAWLGLVPRQLSSGGQEGSGACQRQVRPTSAGC